MERFTVEQMGDRFHVREPKDQCEYALVWKTEGKNQFTAVVPSSEAWMYEKVKLP